MSEGLKPCPFCGGPEIPPAQIYCATCKTNISGLGDHWNNRPIEDALQARIVELETAIVYLANLRSAYWDRPRNGHGWRLIETDCGAMRLLAEGATPLEAVEKAREAQRWRS